MRDVHVIDSELRLLVAVRRAVVAEGGPTPSLNLIDGLLDERNGRTPQAVLDSPQRRPN